MSKEMQEEILRILLEVKDDVIHTKERQYDYRLMLKDLVATLRDLKDEVVSNHKRISELEAQVAEHNERIARLERIVAQQDGLEITTKVH
ncbi:hypothetical protein F9B85_00910 [Heliorestis acidaminivorans]|uniref:Uncharacterized protein n=1 Tax=Heliorestis acidaminivorans TaxID=553427 RepID=A0A6I0F039_9FIRM|nr:hypothetical protein [Heliorestis acidaminivorans]KAB2954286.1 hypothetical protein F9B85_00910 [Heliorestis acidaminivorans]